MTCIDTISEFTHFVVCDLSENAEGFLDVCLLLGSQETVALQYTQLDVAARRLRLDLLQQLLGRSHGELLRLLLLRGVPVGISADERTRLERRGILSMQFGLSSARKHT